MKPVELANAINALAQDLHQTAIDKKWYERSREIPELLCLVHSELGECLEAARNADPVSAKIPPHSQCVEELADAVIRILDMCAYFKWDIGGALIAKAKYNETRPERHGGKLY